MQFPIPDARRPTPDEVVEGGGQISMWDDQEMMRSDRDG
jgi:hypothetical protein